MKDTKLIGDISEAAIIKEFLKKGYKVLKPFGDNYKYDLVIDKGDGFKKVQCKSGVYRNGTIKSVLARKSYINGKYVVTDYEDGDIDFFAIYCSENDKVYMLPSDVGRTCVLRVEPSKNNQTKNVVFAKNFEI